MNGTPIINNNARVCLCFVVVVVIGFVVIVVVVETRLSTNRSKIIVVIPTSWT